VNLAPPRVCATTDAEPASSDDDAAMPMRVVLVDDDAGFRAAARRALVADGIDVVAELDDGAEVVMVVSACRPDAVLLDIGLRGIDGPEVARRLRAGGDPTVVILISTRDSDYGERMASGLAAGYLPKQELSRAAILDLAALER
jgi:DNA-binding NarL/FixJ family response regulator